MRYCDIGRRPAGGPDELRRVPLQRLPLRVDVRVHRPVGDPDRRHELPLRRPEAADQRRRFVWEIHPVIKTLHIIIFFSPFPFLRYRLSRSPGFGFGFCFLFLFDVFRFGVFGGLWFLCGRRRGSSFLSASASGFRSIWSFVWRINGCSWDLWFSRVFEDRKPNRVWLWEFVERGRSEWWEDGERRLQRREIGERGEL